jgi:hypothetical protein
LKKEGFMNTTADTHRLKARDYLNGLIRSLEIVTDPETHGYDQYKKEYVSGIEDMVHALKVMRREI